MKTVGTRNTFIGLAPLLLMVGAAGQSPIIQRPAPGESAPVSSIDSEHLKDRPYNGVLPKPIFPSTDRVQREFVVQYVYDYAYSAYTPPVAVPVQPREQAKRDTPEAAMIAMLSAVRSGDYDGWLKCWDEKSRAEFIESAKQDHHDAAFMAKAWKTSFSGKDVVLEARVETIGYVVLDYRISGQQAIIPAVFKLVKGEWLATEELNSGGMGGFIFPQVAGTRSSITPQPVTNLTGPYAQEAEAQQEFLRSHSYRSTATLAAK